MNLTSRRVRTLFALCSVGAVVGAGVSATEAFAAGVTLAYGPTATSATVLNLDPTGAAGAPVSYGVKVTGDSNTDALYVNTISTPTNGALYVQKAAGMTGTPAANPAGSAALLAPFTLADGVLTAANPGHVTSVAAPFLAYHVGDAVAGTGVAAGSYITAVGGAGNVTLNSDGGAGHAAEDMAVGARAVNDGATTNGSTTLTATLNFTSADVGATIVGPGIPASTTIVSVTNTTTVVLSAAATATAAGVPVAVGYTATGTAGATTLSLNSTSGAAATLNTLLAGRLVKIKSGTGTAEIAKVVSVAGTTVTLDRGLAVSHSGPVTVTDLATASAGDYWSTVGAGDTGPVTLQGGAGTWAVVDNFYFGAVVPGTYTFRMFKDHNGNGVYDSAQDDATPTFTLTVKDVSANTTTTADDWSPAVTVPSSIVQGLTVPVSIATNGATVTDTRGSNPATGVGYLGENIAATIGVTFSGNVVSGPTAPTFDGTNFTIATTATSGTTAEGVSITGLASTAVTRSVTVTDNDVATVTSGATDVVGSAKLTSPAEAVKTGTASVAYTATVTVGGTDKSSKVIYFTLTPGTNNPALTADGTLVSTNATTGVKVYSAITNATGVATLNVTSGTTTAGTTYTVAMASNTHSGTTLTATYADAAASTFTLTTPTASMYPTVGGSVAIAGTLNDQFGATFQPPLSATQQVTVNIDQNNTVYGSADVTGYATLTAGGFSYTYTPTTAATVGRQDVVQFAYGSVTDATHSVYWTSATAPTSVTITGPVAASAQPQQKATATLTKAGAALGTAITGSVLDASSVGLPYKSVTLTGTPGVYFSTSNNPGLTAPDDLATTITAAANSSGAYSGVYAFFTKAGNATITATSGTATATVTVSVTQDADPYTVTVTGTTVAPGGTSVVTGTANNGFGFPVSGATVNLSLGTSTIATLGATSVTTNADGVWSTTVTGASAGTGDATLTATLGTQTANATADTTWLTKGGLTVAAGVYQATATVTVDPTINQTTITAPASRVGAGYVALRGTAKPSTAVEIYGKASASSAAFGLVGLAVSDADGAWSSTQYVSATSVFFAKTSVSTSSTVTVRVTARPAPARSTAHLTARALGHRRVQLVADGGPTGRGVLHFYRWNGHSWVSLAIVRANVRGDATIVVSSPRGVITFRVVYTAPGRGSAGDNASVRVR